MKTQSPLSGSWRAFAHGVRRFAWFALRTCVAVFILTHVLCDLCPTFSWLTLQDTQSDIADGHDVKRSLFIASFAAPEGSSLKLQSSSECTPVSDAEMYSATLRFSLTKAVICKPVFFTGIHGNNSSLDLDPAVAQDAKSCRLLRRPALRDAESGEDVEARSNICRRQRRRHPAPRRGRAERSGIGLRAQGKGAAAPWNASRIGTAERPIRNTSSYSALPQLVANVHASRSSPARTAAVYAHTAAVAAAADAATAAPLKVDASAKATSRVPEPVILLVEPSGAIGFGATHSSLLLFGIFDFTISAVYVDGVQMGSSAVAFESAYAIRLAYIPASPSESTSTLFWFAGADTLHEGRGRDCDAFQRRNVQITFVYQVVIGDDSSASTAEYNATITLDGNDGRPLLARFCTFTPLLLSLSSNVRVMEPWAIHAGYTDLSWNVNFTRLNAKTDTALDGGVAKDARLPFFGVGPFRPPTAAQRLTLVMHPQRSRVAGQPQQDAEAHVRRFSVQPSPLTYSDVEVDAGLPRLTKLAGLQRAQWWAAHTTQIFSQVAPKDVMYSNVSFLWSVGEVTGDLLTATVLKSLDVAQESYGLHLVLPALTQTAHTVTLPTVLDVMPYRGVRFWNQMWMVATTYYDMILHGAFPRSTLVVNADTQVALRTLRFPALSDGDPYAGVDYMVDSCKVSGAGSGDAISCQVAVTREVYDEWYDAYLNETDPMDTCGGGVVVDLYVAHETTAEAAAGAVVNGSVGSSSSSTSATVAVTPVQGFPLSVAANSVLHLSFVLEAAPLAWQILRRSAAASAAAAASSSADAASSHGVTSATRDYVTLRYTFVYKNRRSGTYRLHCDGSAEDMQVSVRTYSDPHNAVYAHCIRSPDATTSHFRHAVINHTFDYESALYINVSCAFPLSTLLNVDATRAAFCGVALEGLAIDFYAEEAPLLPAYAVYELRLPLTADDASDTATDSVATTPAAYVATLSSSGSTTPIAVLDLPAVSTAQGCYELPWHVAESAAAHLDGSLYGQRWGGLGYSHSTFVVTATDGARYCHTFVAFQLPVPGDSAATTCAALQLSVRDVQTGSVGGAAAVDAERVFCGSRSYFMDPISALQLRVPLTEVPRMVDLDSYIPDTETGYVVYQYCVDVVFDLYEQRSSTGAYAQNGPLIYTILDTANTPSEYVPWVRSTVPDSSASLVLGDTLYFRGESLRYYDASGKQPLTGTRFAIQLAEVVAEECGDYYLVEPSGAYPELTAQWVNESTIALPITADVPGGWFNLTMTQGQAGEVYVSCGLSFRVMGAITSVTTTDVARPAGGTTVHIRGVNLPMTTAGSNVTLTIGYADAAATIQPRRCIITFSLGTRMTCTTPAMPARELERLAVLVEETPYAYTYWLPLNLTSYFYNGTSGEWELFQSINIDTVGDGAGLLSLRYRVDKMTVSSVTPTVVSPTVANPTFNIRGEHIQSRSVLLCDASTITPASTPETTSCILCLPRAFSTTALTCDALWPLNASEYHVYVSDTPLDGDTGFTVRSMRSVARSSPSVLYPYSEGVLLTVTGSKLNQSMMTDMILVAKSRNGVDQQRYNVPFESFTETTITARAPDFSWMGASGGVVSLHVYYGLDEKNLDDLCRTCTIEVIPASMVPSIHSISPFAGQAPMLINVYGAGFTKMRYSPALPASLGGDGDGIGDAPSFDTHEAWMANERTYITIGADPCRILNMLNTLIVCNLTTPCANVVPSSVVRLVSRTLGSTAAVATSAKLFFYCTMSLTGVSHTSGSVVGGQELTIRGVGFPSSGAQLIVTVAGLPCTVSAVTRTNITCVTSASPTGETLSGAVTVRAISNGRESSCCVYTYNPDITPTLTSVSPSKAAAGARLLLFGTNFPYGTSNTMTVLFGLQRLAVTDIESSTRASVTIPSTFFGRDFLAVHVANVGNSARTAAAAFTVLMTPSMMVPSVSGFRGRSATRLVGTNVGANRSAAEVAALFDVLVCGRPCTILDSNSEGEVMCQVPTYMDEEMVARYRASLDFPRIDEGFAIQLFVKRLTMGALVPLKTASLAEGGVWGDVSSTFNVRQLYMTPSEVDGVTTISIASSDVVILLQARQHSRLLLYNVTLDLTPAATRFDQLDLTNATCRLHLSTAEAEKMDLADIDINPYNASAWRAYRSGESADYTWPALQVGANSLNFNGLGTLPTAAYVLITCEGLPVNVLELQGVIVNGYQVGLDASGGRCPVNIRAAHRVDQPYMNSCTNRTGDSCPVFNFVSALTPVVTRYDPAYALANDVGARITLYGSGFGRNVSAVSSILLDKALCTPVAVSDGELVCTMQGRVSREADWQVLWTDESGRGAAMLLSAQPFYAAVTWSSYLAWRGEGLPREGQIVVIPRGNTILLDITPPALTGMLLYGVLIVSDTVDIDLRLGLLAISETGALIAGSASNPHRHKFTITLATNMFQDSPLYYIDDIASISQQTEPYLDKVLEVLGGTLQLHGTPPTVPTALLAVTAHAGDAVITVDRWVPWVVGDTVALVTKSDRNPHHIEERVIAKRVTNASHTVLHFSSAAPLLFQHVGLDALGSARGRVKGSTSGWASGWDDAAYAAAAGTEVVYLTRTICIRGDDTSAISAVGAALWLDATTTSQLSHVELYRTGKRGSKVSYSVWLRGISYPADWMVLDDVVVHNAYYRGVVVQETRHVVLNRVTVLYADGFGIAAIGASDESLTLQNSSIFGMYGDSGGTDTVAAGLFISSADVTLRSSEVCVSDSHGVWFALRFLFVSATARTCPAQTGLTGVEDNRIHHTGGHGLLVYPLHFNVGDRCALSQNSAAANDPANVSAAQMLAAGEEATPMLFAGTLQNQVIFSCGLYGVYLPPSSGYVLLDTVIMDCAAASLFSDYTTNTTVVRHSFLSVALPDGTCSRGKYAWIYNASGLGDGSDSDESTSASDSGSNSDDNSSFYASAQYCSTLSRLGLQAQHGGHLSLYSLALDNFTSGRGLRLATLSVPSSAATTYPSGSFGALRSAHLTVRVFNLTSIGTAPLQLVLAGEVAVVDVDGQLTQSNVSSFLFYGGVNYSRLPSFCRLYIPTVDSTAEAEGSSDGSGNDGEVIERDGDDEQPGSVSLDDDEAPMLMGVIAAANSPQMPLAWIRGVEEEVRGVGGRTVVKLTASSVAPAVQNRSFKNALNAVANAWKESNLVVCAAPSKQLSLMFVRVTAGETTEDGRGGESAAATNRCSSVTAELREGDSASFLLSARMHLYTRGGGAAASSAVSFYVLTEDDDVTADSNVIITPASAYAVWNAAVETTETTWGRAGFYTLASTTNLTFAFCTATGAVCYPSELSINVDPSLPWPTSAMMTRARVAPSASYFERVKTVQSPCTQSPLLASITWTNDDVSDAGSAALHNATQAPQALTTLSLISSYSASSSTVMLNLAQNPACLSSGSATAVGSNTATTSSKGPWNTSASLWAEVRITTCGSDDNVKGIGCIGPQFPYLRHWVTHNASVPTSATYLADTAPFVSWYSAAAWLDGVAPWNADLSDTADPSASAAPAWYRDAYIIPLGARVNLTMTEAVQVRGVLVVVGELSITTSAATTSSVMDLHVTTLIVLGKLRVTVEDPAATPVRIVLGWERGLDRPYRLDADTLVYPGALYAAGEVELKGATSAPTVWKSSGMVNRSSTQLPALVSAAKLVNLREWCTLQARWAVAKSVVSGDAAAVQASQIVRSVAKTLDAAAQQCLLAVQDYLPAWMQWTTEAAAMENSKDVVVGWRQGERIGLTSGVASIYGAEESTVRRDINATRVGWRLFPGTSTKTLSVTTKAVDTDAVTTTWSLPHGHVHARDPTSRLEGYGVGTEAVRLTKTVQLDCAIERGEAGRGCVVLIRRQLHPERLFNGPRFRGIGISVRHFGKGGQMRGAASPVQGVEPLTFLPAVYVNVSTGNAFSAVVNANATKRVGHAVLMGSVVEDSHGTAVYADRRNTRLFMMDSAVWYSEGGGVRLDGGGTGVFLEGVVVAGTRYFRHHIANVSSGDDGVVVDTSGLSTKFNTSELALRKQDVQVESLCSVLVNYSHIYLPTQSMKQNPYSSTASTAPVVAAAGGFVKNVVVGGSESEGFCLPWSGTGGPRFIANNAAHSNSVGVFLFKLTVSSSAHTFEAFFAWDWVGVVSAEADITKRSAVGVLPAGGGNVDLFTPSQSFAVNLYWIFDIDNESVTDFTQWRVYNSRFIGIYSSSHQNVTIAQSDIFANPIGVALAVDPDEASGFSRVVDSYIATFPRCSCRADMYNASSFIDDPVDFWKVCQVSPFKEPAWQTNGCGELTFIDGTYHYAAVLAMPSYAYVPLSYNRSTVFTAPAGDVLESTTQGRLELNNVCFGAVGELNVCESNRCNRTATATTGSSLRSAAIMGTTGESLRSSASLYAISTKLILYAPSSALGLDSWVRQSPPQSFEESDGVSIAEGPTDNMGAPNNSDNASVNCYLPLAGTAASVLRLRPTSASTATPAATTLSRLASRIRDYCAASGISATSGSAVVTKLQDAYESPYVLTVVYSSDGSLYNVPEKPRSFVPRGASQQSLASRLLLSMCAVALATEEQLLECPYDAGFYQLRLHSNDDRVSRGAAVPILFTSTTATALSAIPVEETETSFTNTILGTTATASLLQPPTRDEAGLPASTVSDAIFRSSALQQAFLVPQSTTVIQYEQLSYPDSFELHIAACAATPSEGNLTVVMMLPLLDESITVQVWGASTRLLLNSVTLDKDASPMSIHTLRVSQMTSAFQSVQLSSLLGVDNSLPSALSDASALWTKLTRQSSNTGAFSSTLVIQPLCNARLSIHQLVYATLVLHTTEDPTVVMQQLLRDGTDLTVQELLSLEQYPTVNSTYFAEHVHIVVASMTPDDNAGEGMTLNVKVEAIDSFDYNVTTAMEHVAEFASLFSPLYSYSDDNSDAVTNSNVAVTAASTCCFTVTIAGVLFNVLMVIPPLLPSERYQLQSTLSAVDTVTSGTVAKGSLITFATVVPAVLLLMLVFVVVRYGLPVLRERKAVSAVLRRSATSSLDISAATMRALRSGAAPSASTVAVVWVAGLLRTTLGATLDKAGVTRTAAETVEVLQGTTNTAPTTSASGNVVRKRGSSGSSSTRSVKIARQLFLLPSYDALSGTSADADTASVTLATLFAPQCGGKGVARTTDPQYSQDADRQRYVDSWCIAPHTMARLTRRAEAGSGARGGLVSPLPVLTSPCPLRADRLGSSSQHVSHVSSPLQLQPPARLPQVPGRPRPHAERVTPPPGLAASDGARTTSPSGTESVATATPPPASVDTAKALSVTPEYVIPVGVDSAPAGTRDAAHGGAQQRSSAPFLGSLSGYTPTVARLPPLPSVLVRIGEAGGQSAPPLPSAPRPSLSAAADAGASPHSPSGMPVPLQSILTTSILAGVSAAYPQSMLHVTSPLPNGHNRDVAEAAPSAPLVAAVVSASGVPSDDVTMVLRGRGNILFTTPDADVDAVRARRSVSSAPPGAGSRFNFDDRNSTVDHEN